MTKTRSIYLIIIAIWLACLAQPVVTVDSPTGEERIGTAAWTLAECLEIAMQSNPDLLK